MEETVKLFSRYRVPILVEKKQWETEKRNSKKKTHEEYVEELNIKNPNVEVIGKYINAKTKITHHCLIHDVYWDILPSNALKGNGCIECGNEKIRNKNIKPYEQYIEELQNIHLNISHVGRYINASTPTLHKCTIDGHEWMATPVSILQGQGCPRCANNIKWTHDKYVLEVELVNNNIEVIGEYINMKTPILHLCKKHNVKWKAQPNNILLGRGCIECGKEKIKDKFIKSHEQYINEVKEINSNIIVIGQYVNSHTPILHKCFLDGFEWTTAPTVILSGSGCPNCANNIKKTHEQYIKDIKNINPSIEVLECYINMKTPILHKCKLHNIQWKVAPISILRGSGCKQCGTEKTVEILKKTHEQYVKELKIVNPQIVVVENYINVSTSILHKCLIDNYEWYAKPNSILSGYGCPKCAGNIKKTHEEYVYELSVINPDIEVIDAYIGANIKILHRCKNDNYTWYVKPSSILSGNGCPQCRESSGERQVRQWLEKHSIKYIYQQPFNDCRDIRPLPFDFYLPDYNSCVEYDDRQHFEPIDFFGGQKEFEYTVKHDNIKNEYCKNNGISLLRIPYYKNIEEELNNFLFI